ncbi:MAG: HAMP domain-containing sensor histidine kinase, partial [Nitrospirota bacterium]
KADFLAMLTHDLKSPLTTITGYSDLLLVSRGELGPDKANMVEIIEQSSEKMLRMIDDFLVVSRLEAGHMRIILKPENLYNLLEKVATDFMPALKKKSIHFQTDFSVVPLTCVDYKYIERSVANLLLNAIHYTPRGGKVVLKAERGFSGDILHVPYLAISVADTGPGIPEGEKDRVFDKYFTTSKARGIKGTGLGLAIVKAVAEAHGGRAAVESEPGKGSTFHIYLPLNDQC